MCPEHSAVATLIARVEGAWRSWSEYLAPLDEKRLREPGACGDWSVRDIIAHITWFEREMTGMIADRVLAGSDLWALPPHERNAAIDLEQRDRPLADILQEAEQAHALLVDALSKLSDEDLTDASRFSGMPRDWVPERIIAQNSYEHYEAHLAGLCRSPRS